MADEPEVKAEVIHQQMEETRSNLQAKLETLEQQVKDTVQEATEAVTDTVATVKETVKETVETVKETVEETVDSVKETFNLSRHVQEHPWPAFACATAVGFVGTRLALRLMPDRTAGAAPTAAPTYSPISAIASAPSVPSAPSAPEEKRSSWWSWLVDHYSEELDKIKGLAVATAGGILREMLTENVQPEFGQRVKEVIDGFTTKLGGQPIEGPILLPVSSPTPPPLAERRPEDYTPRTERFTGTSSR
jgi:ElaB/YqjD/DUF883 family membrane-anchored ribosome-binding protein